MCCSSSPLRSWWVIWSTRSWRIIIDRIRYWGRRSPRWWSLRCSPTWNRSWRSMLRSTRTTSWMWSWRRRTRRVRMSSWGRRHESSTRNSHNPSTRGSGWCWSRIRACRPWRRILNSSNSSIGTPTTSWNNSFGRSSRIVSPCRTASWICCCPTPAWIMLCSWSNVSSMGRPSSCSTNARSWYAHGPSTAMCSLNRWIAGSSRTSRCSP